MPVDRRNVAAIAAALPAELLALVQKGELSFTVQDSTDLPPREDYIEATRAHSRSVTLGEGKLNGYVAGMPFPGIEAHDPRAGEKVMWNFRYRDRGDAKEYWGGVRSLTANGAVDRTISFHGLFLYGIHRPDSRKNVPQWEQDGVYYTQLLEFTAPPDIRDNLTLTTRYDNDTKPDSQSAYDVQVRRVRHPPVYHLASVFGLYTLVEDQWGFSGYLHPYRWRFLGKQVVLVPGLAKADHLTLGGRGGWYPTAPWELRQVYVAERRLPSLALIDGLPPAPEASQSLPLRQGLRVVSCERNTWLLGAYGFLLFGTMTMMQGLWAVPYLMDVYGYRQQEAAATLTLWAVGLIIGCTLWGYVADMMGTRKGVVVPGAAVYGLLWALLMVYPEGLSPGMVNLAMF
jgi:hypothetical protein